MSSGLTQKQRMVKRTLDLAVAIPGLILCIPVIAIAWAAATLSTRSNGLFVQQRIGRNGKPFPLFKIRSMRIDRSINTSVTTEQDRRITRLGALLRKTKIDELPQLANVVLGHMSLVGPRPDIAGFADQLTGDDRALLTLRPGITGPASLEFRDEERLLANQDDPEKYNKEVIWPRKVAINRAYLQQWSLALDLKIIFCTVLRQ